MEFERPVQKIGENSISVTIPIDLVKYLGIEPKDILIFEDHEDAQGLYFSCRKKKAIE